jgi:hypothetical protein
MKTEKKILSLVNHGFKTSTLLKLNENQINLLFNKLQEQTQPNVQKQTKTVTTYTVPSNTETEISTAGKNVVVSNKGGVTKVTPMETEVKEEIDFLMDVDEEMNEKFESKAQQGLFWARCNKCSDKNCKWCKMAKEFSKSTSKKQYEKMPEKKHPEKTVKYKKKETKENYMDMMSKGITNNFRLKLDDVKPSVSFDNMSEEKLEKNIMKLVEKHILPKMSKKDLISFISEQGTKEKEKERTKEKEKEKSPSTPYKPKPGPKPNPKASKKEVDEQETAPVKTPPKTKPTTKPNKPGTPYSPKPGPKPAPKAGKKELPNWLSFSKIGINLK